MCSVAISCKLYSILLQQCAHLVTHIFVSFLCINLQNPDQGTRYAFVPPHTMEKWFDLADVVPSANPLNGQDTGKSLSNIYRSILTQITIKNLKEQGAAVQSLYNQAIGFLNTVLPHPENLSENTTRLALYNEYKEQYNERRLEMENIILKTSKSWNHLRMSCGFREATHHFWQRSKVHTSGGLYLAKRSSATFTSPTWTLAPQLRV